MLQARRKFCNTFRYPQTFKSLIRSQCYATLSNNPKVEDNTNQKEITSAIQKDKVTWKTIKSILELARPEAKRIGIGLFALAVSTCVSLYTPIAIGNLVDAINLPDSALAAQNLKKFTLFLGGIFGVGAIATGIRASFINIAGIRIATSVREKLFSRIIEQDVGFFDENKSGELVNRLSTDVQVVSETLTSSIVSGMRSLCEAVGGVILLLYLSSKLTGIAMSIFPALGIVAVFYGRYIKTLSKKYMDALAQTTSTATEKFNFIRVVKLFTGESREIKHYTNEIQETFRIGKNVSIARAVFYATISFATNMAMLLVLYYGGLGVISSEISMGSLTSFLIYSIYLGISFTNLSSVYGDIMKTVGSSQRIFELLGRVPAIPTSGGKKLPQVTGKIEFKNVNFVYPTRADVPILKNFNLQIEPGSIVALVGASGSGKSTVASLLTRLYDTTSGSILIDGVDLKELDPKWWRSQVGVVSQEPILFSSSIAENIKYGVADDEKRAQMSQEDVENAAKMAYAHEFIQQLPQQYDTPIVNTSLSGGQRQRVVLARALIKHPSILVLDESTSSLDSYSEHMVQTSLEHIMEQQKQNTGNGPKTTIIIAHRLSTIRAADYIVVVNNGAVEELGTHDELLNKESGIYKKLVELQLNPYQKFDKQE